MMEAHTTNDNNILSALPPPLLSRIARTALAAQGLPAVFALSASCTALRAACDDALATTVAIAPTGLRGWRPAEAACLKAPCPCGEGTRCSCAKTNAGSGRGTAVAAATARAISRVVRAAPLLARLDLSGAYWFVSDAALCKLGAAWLPSLEALVLDHCEQITGRGLWHLFRPRGLGSLRELSLNGCGDLSGCDDFAGLLPPLTTLRAAFCRGFPLLVLHRMDYMKRLKTLDLTGCPAMRDALCADLRAAEWLSLALAEDVGDEGLALLAAGSLRLRQLFLARRSDNVFSTGRWTQAGVDAFRRLRPEVEIAFIM